MRGQHHRSERIHRTDPRSGVPVTQITSDPRPSFNLYFEHNHFTPDSRTFIFTRQRHLGAGAPRDLYRCDIDGTNLVQLSDEDGIYAIALARDGRCAYYVAGTTLKRVTMDTCELEEVLQVEGAQPGGVGLAGQSGDGRWLFCTMRVGDDTGLYRLATDGSAADLLHPAPFMNHVSCDPGHDVVSFNCTFEGEVRLCLIDADGGRLREFPLQRFAHCAWLGRSGRMQGCLLPPGRAIMAMAEHDQQPEPIVAGPYFWHSGASLDGEWIVADTNWPDEGLQLVHVPTRSFMLLCDAHAMNGDSLGGHPEPAISPDGSAVIYTSNATGMPQVYIARVPQEMRDALRRSLEWQGPPCAAGDHYLARPMWVKV